MQTWQQPTQPPSDGLTPASLDAPGGQSANGGGGPRAPRFPEGFTLVAAALLGALLVVAGLLLWQQWSSGGELATAGSVPSTTAAAVPQTTVPTTGPSSTAPPDTEGSATTVDPAGVQVLACPSGIDPVVCDAAAYVQQARQRAFKTFPPVELLADTEFDRALLADFDDSRADLEDEGVILTALGLLDPGVTLADAYRDALEMGVVGFYDPKTGRLVVRASSNRGQDSFNLYVRQVMVHELTHALDDQWFNLDRSDFADLDAEYGFTAVVEGNAHRVDQQWQNQLDPASQAQLQTESLTAVSPADLLRYFALPPILQQLQLSPYSDGAAYVGRLVAGGGEAAADEAITEPPGTSEDILNPDRARATDPEVVLDPPPAAATTVTSGRLGELIVQLWLGPAASDGWGGDHAVTWREGKRSCIAVDLAADTPSDLAEVESAAKAWTTARPADRTAASVTSGGVRVVRATGCAG
jgi:hypothetical protein